LRCQNKALNSSKHPCLQWKEKWHKNGSFQ
jgi:hypothetical protein